MNVEVFISETEKLKNKYKRNGLNKQLLNELWSEIKTKNNDFIIDRVKALMFKPINYRFTKEDFMSDLTNKSVVVPKRHFQNRDSLIRKKIKNWNLNRSLEKTLESMGVSNLVEAMEKAKGLK